MSKHYMEEVSTGVFRLNSDEPGPDTYEHNNIILYRFMDQFYICREHLDEMSQEEVSHLCRARLKFPQLITAVNGRVKEYFKRLINSISPRKILEIGAGESPLFPQPPAGMEYAMADADIEVKKGLRAESEFNEFSGEDPVLNYPDNHFDMAVAVFVLQFPFPLTQVAEIYRCLADDGVMVANIYRRQPTANASLREEFSSAGLIVHAITDPESLCKAHEYWIIGKNKDKVIACAATLHDIIQDSMLVTPPTTS